MTKKKAKRTARPRALVLLSGGAHSRALLHYAHKTHDATALTVEGLKGFSPETDLARMESNRLGLPHIIEELPFMEAIPEVGSMTLLLELASFRAHSIGAKTVLVGCRELGPKTQLDKRWTAIQAVQSLISETTGIEVMIVAPFVKSSDEDVRRIVKRWGVDDLLDESLPEVSPDLCPDEGPDKTESDIEESSVSPDTDTNTDTEEASS